MSTKVLVALLAAGVFIALGGFLIKQYGGAENESGKAGASLEQLSSSVDELERTIKELERVSHETSQKSDDAIDADLRRLGIMRDYKDR